MQNETLGARQCERFYDLRDSLAIAAHAWLGFEGSILIDEDDPDLFNERLVSEDYRESLPATRALRKYLDEHVPDSQDDYLFADAVIEELIKYMSFGIVSGESVRTCLEILEQHGYSPDEAHLRKPIDLLMNMVNAMPTWANNGWAPRELHEAATGLKVFYNEDGSVRKIERNEPCPCGSGKKYKRCCEL